MKTKCLAVVFILLFIGTCTFLAIADTKILLPTSRGNTLYVGGSGPGNYTRIQDAVDNASDGDTVFVYDDSSPYNEKIAVNKSILLLGENKDTTIIESSNGTVVRFSVNKVQISGFTIQNSGLGTSTGIKASTSNNIISNNIIKGHDYGIFLFGSNNTIYGNFIINNDEGIRLDSINIITSINNTINRNEIANSSSYSMYLDLSHSNHIYENNFRRSPLMTQHIWWIYDCAYYLKYPLKRNQWDENYWDHTRSVPKILPGRLFWPLGEYLYLVFPCCQFDKHPVKEPYNI